MSNNNNSNELWGKIKKSASDGVIETIQGLRESGQNRLVDEYNRGFSDSMVIAVSVFLECEMSDDVIINYLMYKWDLRKTDALKCLSDVKNGLKNGLI